MIDNNKLFYWSEAKRELMRLLDDITFNTVKQPSMVITDNFMMLNAMISAYNGGVMALRNALAEELGKEAAEHDAGGA